MSSTDDRIVQMRFDNAQFKKGAADTQKSLADLNKATDAAGKTKGLLDLNSQMGTVGVTASKMAIVTTTALATIANKATNVALGLAKSLTFDPIKAGFTEYEELLTKQNTIMNATGESSKVVKGHLTDLNKYSDQTIYSFGNMTASIVKFVNAGISLPQSVKSIKGVANAAAFAGASSDEASRAMYAFSQSMGTGYLMLNDWMQIENANMGTIQFKETLLESAAAAGTLTKNGDEYITSAGNAISATKGWRDGLQDQWATTEVMNKALAKYTDLHTKLGREATESATEVRTFSAFMDTLKESLGSGWAAIFTSLIGNLKQATTFWTSFSEAVGNVVGNFFDFISIALKTWRQMGGFEKVLQGFKNILAPFAALLGAIGDAWAIAFPSSNKGAGKALYGLSAGFELVTRPLKWLAAGIPKITPLLTLLFTAIATGGRIVGNVIGFIVDFVSTAREMVDLNAPNTGGFLGFVQKIVKAVRSAVDQVDTLLDRAGGLAGYFGNVDIDLPGLPSMGSASEGADKAGDAAASTASGIGSAMSTLRSIAVKMGEAFSWMWDQATSFFERANPEDFVRAFNAAIFATMAFEIIRFTHYMSNAFKSFVDIGGGVAGILNGAGDALSSFQTQARAKLILNIAIALGILAASLWVISRIPIEDLLPALGAIGVLFFMMNRSMKGFAKALSETDKMTKSVNMVALAASMLLLSVAMIAFATAMLIMNKVEWQSIAKGLITLTVALKLVESLGNMAADSYKNMLGGAVAIGLVAGAMLLLAGALLLFKLVDWGSMGKAGAALAGVTLAVAALALIPYQGIAKVGLALMGASAGILLMANALIVFALVKWEDIGKAAVVLGLLTLSLAVLMAVGGPASVGAMLGLAGAMVLLAGACIMFNAVDWESIGKAAVVLTVLLAALAVGATIMTVFLYAIAPVAPVLIILAAGFALLGIGLLAFAAAMTIAMGLAAAGTAAFAALATGAAVAIGVFLQTLALQAPIMRKSILTLLREFIQTFVDAVPMIIRGVKDVWNAIVKELGSGDKKRSFGEIMQEWINKLIEFARKNIPKLQRLAVDMALSMLQALADRADEFADAGTELVVNLIRGIGQRNQALITAVVDLVIQMAEGLRKNVDRMLNAGVDLVAGFLHDLASTIRGGSAEIGSGVRDVVDAFRDVGVNMIRGLIEGASSVDIQGFIEGLASQLPGWAKKVLGIESPSKVFRDIGKFLTMGLTKGIQDNAASAIVAVGSMIQGAIALSDEYISKYIQKLDQQAIAARARAQGLAAAAQKAAKSADRTKDKGDDKAAKNLREDAKKADKAADKEEREARQARAAEARKRKWENADAAERAEIRAAQAQNQLAAAKQAEREAAAARVQANALKEQARKAGSEKERKQLLKEAERLRREAREQAERANNLIKNAQANAAAALVWQQKAGEEAAKSFQEQFDAEAKADADAEAFDKLSDAEKAAIRRQQAAELQAKADAHLAKAKELAFTDLQRANELAQQALAEAEQARQFLDEAEGYSGSGPTAEVISLQQSDAAALAFNQYADLYDAAYASAAGTKHIEFKQYNTSPESLSDAEIYRQTNNQLTFAEDKLAGAAA